MLKTPLSRAELTSRTDDLALAVGAHVTGTAIALKALVLSIARQADIDVAAIIADLDAEVARLPVKPIDPRGMVATAAADLLRLATRPKS